VLAGTLRGVLSQRLLPRIGGGRVAAVEVMINTARIADLILDPIKTDEIPRVLEQGTFHLMQSFQQHLVQLVLEGLVDADVAATASGNRHDFELALAHAERKRQAEEAESAAADPDAPLAGHTLAPAITAALKLAGSR
jgi:twitching motility protein PilT